MSEAKFEVKVEPVRRALKVPPEVTEGLSGFSKSMVRRMRREAVNCPVRKKRVAFAICFLCPNFLRRVKGVVHCKGDELEG